MRAGHVTYKHFGYRAFALCALFIAAYWVPLHGTASVWTTSDDYSYGTIIPLVSAYLIWEQREMLGRVTARGYWPALFPLSICVVLSLYAILGSSGNISRPLIPILLILFTLFCFGKAVTRILLFPLAFLIFMVPIPAFLERTLGIYLKSVSSELGGSMIQLLGIPVFVSGNVIDLGVTQLQVVDACNGLRYLFPLIALGFVYAHFFERVTWKKVFCVFATIPIAILTNGLRIAITGVLTSVVGEAAAEGFFHDFTGWSLFLVSFAFLFVLGRILRFLPPKPQKGSEIQSPVRMDELSPPVGTANINKPFAVSVILLLIVGGVSLSTGALPPVKLKGGIASFPVQFAGWTGVSAQVDPEIVVESGAEESFSASYVRSDSAPVSLYIGFRSSAFMENENFFHSPTVCLPSSGWTVVNTGVRKIPMAGPFPELEVSTMLIESMGSRQVVYFWFQTKDKTSPHKTINRFHLTLHALRRDNTYDFFIRPITPVRPGESVADAEKRMDVFVRDMLTAMDSFLAVNVR